jgi:hypothetical protein
MKYSIQVVVMNDEEFIVSNQILEIDAPDETSAQVQAIDEVSQFWPDKITLAKTLP